MLRLRQILLPILFLLFLAPSAYAQEDLLSRLDKATGVKLPDGYGEKVASFVKTNSVMQNKDALAFTEQFIVEKMKEDWGINRQNQLLFVWYAIHDKVVNEDLYDGEDGDDARLEDFETAIENVDACGTAFYDGFMEWMMARSDEYDKLFAEYQKQSAEYQKQSAEYQKLSAEYQKLSAEAKRSMITDNIATIEGYLQDIRYGLGDLKRMKDEGIITMKDTELCMEEFSKTEKDILTQYNPLLKKVQGGLMDGDLDDCLSLSYQLVSATAELVSAISDRRSAEYQKQYAEYQKQYAKATQELIRSLKDDVYAIVSFYDTYLIDPDKESVETRERVRSFKAKVQDVYEIAKKENFDFKDELLKAVGGDENKAKDIFKWLGIE